MTPTDEVTAQLDRLITAGPAGRPPAPEEPRTLPSEPVRLVQWHRSHPAGVTALGGLPGREPGRAFVPPLPAGAAAGIGNVLPRAMIAPAPTRSVYRRA
jgi:hypothetical protein